MNLINFIPRVIVVFTACLLLAQCKKAPSREIITEGTFYTDSAGIFYKTTGRGEPVIIIHGGPGLSHKYLYSHLLPLADSNTLVFYDQRLCGQSSANTDSVFITLTNFSNDIEALRKKLGYDKVHILAHSFGGIIAMEYCTRHPDKVKSLLLVGAVGPSEAVSTAANSELFARFGADYFARRQLLIQSWSFVNHETQVYEQLLKLSFSKQFKDTTALDSLYLDLPSDFYERSQRLVYLGPSIANYDYTPQLTAINYPVVLLYGDYDPLSTHSMPAYKTGVPHAEEVIIKNCGHFPFIEKKKESLKAISDFLSKNR